MVIYSVKKCFKNTPVAACNFEVALDTKAMNPLSVEQTVKVNLSSGDVESELWAVFNRKFKLEI